MTDQLVSFSLAKLAIQIGFTWDNGMIEFYDEANAEIRKMKRLPTQSLLQKYLREIHKVHVSPSLGVGKKWGYHIHFLECKDVFEDAQKRIFHPCDINTYEEALELAMKQVCEWLLSKSKPVDHIKIDDLLEIDETMDDHLHDGSGLAQLRNDAEKSKSWVCTSCNENDREYCMNVCPIVKSKETYKVEVGDIFGGFSIVKFGLSYEDAQKLQKEIDAECDYFTTTNLVLDTDTAWTKTPQINK